MAGGTGRFAYFHRCDRFREFHVERARRSLRCLGRIKLRHLAAVLGIWGTLRARQWMVVLAGCLMILEAIPLMFSLWPLALLAGVGFFRTAYRMPS
jgi:hypothetical protein